MGGKVFGKFKDLNFCGKLVPYILGGGAKCLESSKIWISVAKLAQYSLGGGQGAGKIQRLAFLRPSLSHLLASFRGKGCVEQNMRMMLEGVAFILTQKVSPGRARCLAADRNFCSDSLFTKFYNKESVSKVFMTS